MKTIQSNSLIPIDEDFKIIAGPGAGKTRFLSNHIKNVLSNSEKITGYKKIACITYTNTAVKQLQSEIGDKAVNGVSITTIHSFLYLNIVKPYCDFIPEEYNVDSCKLKGHSDPFVSGKKVIEYINENNKKLSSPSLTPKQLIKLPANFKLIKSWLISMKINYEDGKLFFSCDNKKAYSFKDHICINESTLNILSKNLIQYKKKYWCEGKLDHNDILFFSMILVDKFPFILQVLVSKYPYLFIDEFQDTSPIQAYLLNRLKEINCTVGVVGDIAQSIYSFQGASTKLFSEFTPKKDYLYELKDNWRSNNNIVDFLNLIRTDLIQLKTKSIKGNKVRIIIGKNYEAYLKVTTFCEKEVVSLSRKNEMVYNLNKGNLNYEVQLDILDKFHESDSNNIRRNSIIYLVQVAEFVQNKDFAKAFELVEKKLNIENNSKKNYLSILWELANRYSDYVEGSLLCFYKIVQSLNCINLSTLRKGKALEFMKSTKYKTLAIINDQEKYTSHITIHKSKGAEFNNVLVLEDKSQLKKMLFNPNLSIEEQRIFYVAMSRAKENLFFQINDLTDTEEKTLLARYSEIIEVIRL